MQESPVLFLGQEDPLEKGIGYPLQYSWASLVAQMVKNLPAMQEAWVQSLAEKIPWRREWLSTPASILAWRTAWREELMGYSPWGVKELDMTQ